MSPKKTSELLAKHQTLFRTSKFTIVGIVLTIINFAVYTLLARTLFGNTNELLWLDSLISCVVATFVAYILHSNITWRERHPTKSGIINFFIWNFITALLISPLLTWLFGFITPVYEFIFILTNNINLPFDYAFIESTCIFCFTAFITMILNYLVYDKLVFKSEKATPSQTNKS